MSSKNEEQVKMFSEKIKERIHHQKTCPSINSKGHRKMLLDGSTELQEGIRTSEIVNMVIEYEQLMTAQNNNINENTLQDL